MQTLNKHSIHNVGSGILFCSLIILSNFINAQALIRNSDGKPFDSLLIVNNNRKAFINHSNFRKFNFQDNDQVAIDNKLFDFCISTDTLYFFDKTKEIEGVNVIGKSLIGKKESITKSSRTNAYADLSSNNRVGTFIKIKSSKRTFIKSIVLFPKEINSPSGKLEVQLLNNINELPDSKNPIQNFSVEFPKTLEKNWEIVLPKPIRYPKEGLFIVFYHQAEQKDWNIMLRLNADSQLFMYYPQEEKWKKMSFNGYQYKVKILQ